MPKQSNTGTVSGLSERLGYQFRDESLLRRALTHSSARTRRDVFDDNERLEFLGDRVLGLAISKLLVESFPEAREKELARRLNSLVRAETCAAVARALELGAVIILDPGEAAAGGRKKASILADTCEALLGAVFTDGGYDAAEKVVRHLWADVLYAADEAPIDAKTALQEWSQGQRLPVPAYVTVASEGPDHAPQFTVEVRIPGIRPARGVGASKRAAEQLAAKAVLVREGLWSAQ